MSYLRLPHLHGDLLCFVSEDDLWLAPLDGGARAWRLTVDRTKTGHPRFSPDGRHIAYTSWRSLVPEIHLVPVDGGESRQLTYWGNTDTQVCGWTPPDTDGHSDILAVTSHGEPFSHFTWAYKVSPGGDPGRKLPWGPVTDIQVADLDGVRRTLLLTGTPPHEPAAWKRYRGGATGRLWLHGKRLLADLAGHLHSPMFVAGRIAFLSDHEGIGNLYSCAPRRLRSAPAHRPRRLLRPPRGERRQPRRLPVRRRPVAGGRPRPGRRAPPGWTSGCPGRAPDAAAARCPPRSTSTG
ncbi:hypothetical protein GCM10020256_45070 [Streptomyces thermocoprophilus]